MNYTLSNEVIWLPNQGWDARIHVAANAELVNVFMIVTARYVILLDTLLNPATAHILLDQARADLAHRQLLIVNTHADWDHAWGNQLFAGPTAIYPAPIIAHEECARRLTSTEEDATLRAMQHAYPGRFDDVILTPPTITFTERLTINGGDLTLELLHTPGHTPDHIAVYIPEIRTLFPGDAAELPFPMPATAQTLPTLTASLHALAAYNADVALYCHAPTTTGPRLIHANLAYYDTLERVCRPALARGFDPAEYDDAALPAALHCHVAEVAANTGMLDTWADLDQADLNDRHGEQLRYMLEWLQMADNRGR